MPKSISLRGGVDVPKWGGINTEKPPGLIGLHELQAAENVRWRRGAFTDRPGLARETSGGALTGSVYGMSSDGVSTGFGAVGTGTTDSVRGLYALGYSFGDPSSPRIYVYIPGVTAAPTTFAIPMANASPGSLASAMWVEHEDGSKLFLVERIERVYDASGAEMRYSSADTEYVRQTAIYPYGGRASATAASAERPGRPLVVLDAFAHDAIWHLGAIFVACSVRASSRWHLQVFRVEPASGDVSTVGPRIDNAGSDVGINAALASHHERLYLSGNVPGVSATLWRLTHEDRWTALSLPVDAANGTSGTSGGGGVSYSGKVWFPGMNAGVPCLLSINDNETVAVERTLGSVLGPVPNLAVAFNRLYYGWRRNTVTTVYKNRIGMYDGSSFSDDHNTCGVQVDFEWNLHPAPRLAYWAGNLYATIAYELATAVDQGTVYQSNGSSTTSLGTLVAGECGGPRRVAGL